MTLYERLHFVEQEVERMSTELRRLRRYEVLFEAAREMVYRSERSPDDVGRWLLAAIREVEAVS